ncbi:MAG TPA: hypothetical protein VKA16_00180 [Burkholderiales bacterium]|nr:hypothetical protein [Burkholderiales bacterium]
MAQTTLFFWGAFALKLSVTGIVVVAASYVVERSGPFLGALIAALPTAAGAAYVILALEHPPAFIAASTVGSVASNAAVALFALAYAALAQRRGLGASLGGAIALWALAVAAIRAVSWTLGSALLLNLVVYALTIPASRRYRSPGALGGPAKRGRYDLLARAATVGLVVTLVTAASTRIGPLLTGVFALLPVAMGSFVVILQPRIGGPATASVLANAQAPLLGLGLAFAVVHLAVPLGVWWALLLGLATSFGWSALLLVMRRAPA